MRYVVKQESLWPSNILHSETAPTEGTLQVFPDVGLSNAYIILRPFFRPLVPVDDPGVLDAKNWEYGMSLSHEFHPSTFELSAQIFPHQSSPVFSLQVADT
jgi:hypothetical protein